MAAQNPFIEEPSFFDSKIRDMWFTGQDKEFHTHGEQGGAEGIWNAEGQVQGIWDAPVQTTWKSGAFQDGASLRGTKRLERDMTLGFHCIETDNASAEENESDFRSIFQFAPDEYDDDPEPTTLHIESDQSGERRIDVLLYDTPVLECEVDPIEQQYFNLILKVRAGQPDWYEYDKATGQDYKTVFEQGSTDGSGFIEVQNPTDRDMRHQWVLTRATWSIPDFSWRGGRYKRRPAGQWADRILTLQPITDTQGGIVISLNGQDLMIRDHNYTNALPAMLPNGQHFMHVIPAYTPKTLLPISYTGAPAGGARAELIQPRHWTRPWGQE